MDKIEILDSDGVETLYVHTATVSALIRFLHPQIPWIWILGHMPNRHIEWWQTCLPINKHGASAEAEFRALAYDLMLPTAQFLDLVPAFEDHGLVLIQSHKRMPDSFNLAHIPENQQAKVLRQNGAFLRMYLPHAYETAQVQCFERGYLAGVAPAPANPKKVSP